MRRRWANWSLRKQLSLAVTLIMVLLLVVFSTILYVAVRSFLIDQTATQLRIRARALLGTSADGPTTAKLWSRLPTAPLDDTNRTRLQAVADALTTADTSVVVYNPDATVAFQGVTNDSTPRSDPAFGPPFAHPRQPLAPPTLDRWAFERAMGGDTNIRSTGRGFDRQLAVFVPVFQGPNLVAVMQVATPLSQTDAVLRWLLFALISGTALVAVTALLLSLWATRTIINPLGRVVAVSQQVAQGDLEARTNLRSRNEIGQLGAAFDHMVTQLQAAFTTQRRFIADAAHELRTPLTAVGGLVEMLMLGAIADPAQQRRSLQRMNGELERMGRLVDDLLTLSRLDARPSLRREPVDLAALAREVALGMPGITLDHQLTIQAPSPVIIAGDPDRLRQVVLNVLENARKYTPAGGSIRMTVEQHDNTAIVAITDTGIGIPAADVPHVWDRFYRVDQARTRASGGTGLGLAIVKGIVEAHGGRVALTSIVGEGTTVTLMFPLAAGLLRDTESRREEDRETRRAGDTENRTSKAESVIREKAES